MTQLWDFPGGIHPPANKRQSTHLPIQQAPLAARYILSLKQHTDPALPCVEIGQRVLKGETIALPGGPISTALHAPTSGTVAVIGEQPYPHVSGTPAQAIVIDSDGHDQWIDLHSCPDFRRETAPALLERIRAAGISGLGGAGFPTETKLSARPAEKLHTLVVNGAECEPYISADDLLMRERAAELMLGIDILTHLLVPEQVLIGIEDDKPEAIAALSATLGKRPYQIRILPTKYPVGGENQLIQSLTGKEVPTGRLPTDIGILCQNVATLVAVHDAVLLGRPLISRITTLTGNALAQPMNIEALIGTPVGELLSFAGLKHERLRQLLMGGPMMGFSLPDLHVPLIKTCNCLIATDAEELPSAPPAMPCIRCGDCALACPAGLLPQQLYFFALGDRREQLQAHHLFDCIECGACAYVCPSSIPLVQYYRTAKLNIREQQQKRLKAEYSRERFEQRRERLRREEERKATERTLRAEKTVGRCKASAGQQFPDAPAGDPIQAVIERAKACRQASSCSEQLKRLKIEAGMARMALKKAEKQLLSHDTPEQHSLVTELRTAAEAADKALTDACPPYEESPTALLGNDVKLKHTKIQATMARVQLKRSEKAFGDTPNEQQQVILTTLKTEIKHYETCLANLECATPKAASPADDGQAVLNALDSKHVALNKAEQTEIMDNELERLREKLHAAADTRGKSAPQLMRIKKRIQKRLMDARTYELKTELAYARAELKKLERNSGTDNAALEIARAHLYAAEHALTEHGLK